MEEAICPVCLRQAPRETMECPAGGNDEVWRFIGLNHPNWSPDQGICQRCIAQYRRLMTELRRAGPPSADRGCWIIPLSFRLDTDARFTGRGVTIAFLDSGFYLHPDLLEPENRVLAYADMLGDSSASESRWEEMTEPHVDAWHGMMTSVVAAGNGRLSQGVYRGIACEAKLVLVKVGSLGRIRHDDIRRGIDWVIAHQDEYNIQVLNISCGGDYEASYLNDPLSQAAENAVRAGIVVVAAAGNTGNEIVHPVIPPASAPSVITVGGLDDNNRVDWAGFHMYHSSYGPTLDGLQKPEIIAPSIWLAAPILPGSRVAAQALLLETLDGASPSQMKSILRAHRGVELALDAALDRPVTELQAIVRELKRENNLISAHYKHVDGTSFAAPIVSSIVAQMMEAHPAATPQQVKLALIETAERLPGAKVDQQGWGVINPRQAVKRMLQQATRPAPGPGAQGHRTEENPPQHEGQQLG